MPKLVSSLTACQSSCLPSDVYGISISLLLRAERHRQIGAQNVHSLTLSHGTTPHSTHWTRQAFWLRGQNEHLTRQYHSLTVPVSKKACTSRGQKHNGGLNPTIPSRCPRSCCCEIPDPSLVRLASTNLKGNRKPLTSASQTQLSFPARPAPTVPRLEPLPKSAKSPLFVGTRQVADTLQDANRRYAAFQRKVTAREEKVKAFDAVLKGYDRAWLAKEWAEAQEAAWEAYRCHIWETAVLRPLRDRIARTAQAMQQLKDDLIGYQERVEAAEVARQLRHFRELEEEADELLAMKGDKSNHQRLKQLVNRVAETAEGMAEDIDNYVNAYAKTPRKGPSRLSRELPRLLKSRRFVERPEARLPRACLLWLRLEFLIFANQVRPGAHRWRALDTAAEYYGSGFLAHAHLRWATPMYVLGHRLVSTTVTIKMIFRFATGLAVKRVSEIWTERMDAALKHLSAGAAGITVSVKEIVSHGHCLSTSPNAAVLRRLQIDRMQPFRDSQSSLRELGDAIRNFSQLSKRGHRLGTVNTRLAFCLRETWPVIANVDSWTGQGDAFYGRTARVSAAACEQPSQRDHTRQLQPLHFTLPIYHGAQDDARWQYSDAIGPGGRQVVVDYIRSPSTAKIVAESLQSSQVLGLAILGRPGRGELTTSSRFMVQALLLANEERIAIFHLALFPGMCLDHNIPLLRGILEDEEVLKVGINMSQNYDLLSHFEGINMSGHCDLGTMAKNQHAHGISDPMADAPHGDELSFLSKKFLGKSPVLAPSMQKMSTFGLSSMAQIQHCANLPYAAFQLFHAIQSQTPLPNTPTPHHKRSMEAGRTRSDDATRPRTHPGPVNIDEEWLTNSATCAAFPSNKMTREGCLDSLVKSLAVAHVLEVPPPQRRSKNTLRVRRQRRKRLEGVQVCFRAVVFGQIPSTANWSSSYTAGEILAIAQRECIQISPDRRSKLEVVKAEQLQQKERAHKEFWREKTRREEETLTCRAETNLNHVPAKFLKVDMNTVTTRRGHCIQKGRDDILMTIMWHNLEAGLTAIASECFTTPEDVFDAILHVRGMGLFNLERAKLHALVLEFDAAKLQDDAYQDLLPVETIPGDGDDYSMFPLEAVFVNVTASPNLPVKLEENVLQNALRIETVSGDAEDSVFPLQPTFVNVVGLPNMATSEDGTAKLEENAGQDSSPVEIVSDDSKDSVSPFEPNPVNVVFSPYNSSATEPPNIRLTTEPELEALREAERANTPLTVNCQPLVSSSFKDPASTRPHTATSKAKKSPKLGPEAFQNTKRVRSPPKPRSKLKPCPQAQLPTPRSTPLLRNKPIPSPKTPLRKITSPNTRVLHQDDIIRCHRDVLPIQKIGTAVRKPLLGPVSRTPSPSKRRAPTPLKVHTRVIDTSSPSTSQPTL